MKTWYNVVPIIVQTCLILCLYTCHATLGHSSVITIKCFDIERDALLQFKHGITEDGCGLLTSWEPHVDCCQWRGVLCSNQTGHVIKLGIHPFVGEHPDDILCLTGKVSPSLGELKHLKHLNLSFNNFSGEIPHELGNLSKLTTLDLRFSYVVLHVKSLQWISRLSFLRYLDLSGEDLSKVTNWMTIVNNFHSLNVLRMDWCQLPTKIPTSLTFINSSATLHTISLSHNNFNECSIFLWLFNLPEITTQLIYLDLSGNEFPGPIPSEFRNLQSLSYLSLSNNKLQGSVFKIISKLCNLKQLYLNSNYFSDELTNIIQALVSCENKALSTLDLSYNSFWGAIPDCISSFSLLKELYLNDNQLKGEIGQGIGQLTMLEKLDVSSNSLEGTLTHTHFLKLSRLRELYLFYNLRLVIDIDAKWIPPFQLDIILLRSCKLGPHFPKWLETQTNFSYLDVSNANISDTVPVSFWNSLSSNLRDLNMSYNQLYGMLPNVPDILQVDILDLSSNLFEGVVPSGFIKVGVLYLKDNLLSDSSYFLCPKTRVNLLELDLSNNLFSGELPDCWMNLDKLYSLHLENNRFSGSIPKSIGALYNLKYLHLNNNSLSGPIPTSLRNCTSLRILNLGYNSLNGYIPPWIDTAFEILDALILRGNHFIGEIPTSLCQLANLQILDIAINHISGAILDCIHNFTAMTGNSDFELHYSFDGTTIVSWKRGEQIFRKTISLVKYIDLSSNDLSGEIPSGISNLNGLVSLDLSRNKLSGNIPSEIGNLTTLELLDLSNNHLVGEIPQSLAKVSSLGILNVSNNKLFGEIPQSTQLQSFDASSYMGNPGLCGPPLPKCSKDDSTSKAVIGDENHDFDVFPGLYISVVLGFIIGFWAVCGTLVIKTSWRHAYFRFIDDIKDRVLYFI